MKLSLIALVLLPLAAFSQESRFLVNQESEANQIEFTLAMGEFTTFDQNTRSGTLAQAQYTFNFAEMHALNVATELFMQQKQASGVRSVGAGYKGGFDYETATWIYGVQGTLSPGKSTRDNSFRGYHTFQAQSGIEAYVGPAVVQASLVFANNGMAGDNGKASELEGGQHLGIESTAEMPIYKNISAGFGIGVSRATNNAGLLQMISGDSENGYVSQVFGSYKLPAKQGSLHVHLKNEKLPEPMNEKSSTFSLGYSQTL